MCPSSSEYIPCTMYDLWVTQCPIEKPWVQSVLQAWLDYSLPHFRFLGLMSIEHGSCNHPASLAPSMLLPHPVFLYPFLSTMTSGVLNNKHLWSSSLTCFSLPFVPEPEFLQKAQSLLNLPKVDRFPVAVWSRSCSVVSGPFDLTCILRLSIAWV